MRRSRPNLGLREAPPALLEIFDLAGRVEALPGDFAHPATRGHAAGSRRPLVPQCLASRSGSCPARRGGRRRNRPGSPVDGGEATAQLREAVRTLPCPVVGYAAPPEANRTEEPRD